MAKIPTPRKTLVSVDLFPSQERASVFFIVPPEHQAVVTSGTYEQMVRYAACQPVEVAGQTYRRAVPMRQTDFVDILSSELNLDGYCIRAQGKKVRLVDPFANCLEEKLFQSLNGRAVIKAINEVPEAERYQYTPFISGTIEFWPARHGF